MSEFILDISKANERGQVLLPAKIREEFSLKKGDAFLTWVEGDKIILQRLNLEELRKQR
jgi:AbrB family looped-hinge helix DNA binding protein